jgi:hypothetical protein
VGALEGSAGPCTLVVGAGALAVALAAGSARPVRRMAATGAFVAQRTGQLNLTGWIGNVRQSWLDLVAEARAEYDASRSLGVSVAVVSAPIELQAADRAAPAATVDAPPVATVPGVVDAPVAVDAPPADLSVQSTEPAAEVQPATSKRDQRGRFVRRASGPTSNGTRSE